MTLPAPVGILAVLVSAGAIWGIVWILHRKGRLGPEAARKVLHISTGLLGISFPWLFQETWPVPLLVFLTAIGLLAVRLWPRARGGMGVVLHGVARSSLGELYLPLSIAILWVLARGDRLLYVVPLLIVTFADSVAALVGVEYGKHRYDAVDGRKSTEGSLVCFAVAFLCTHIPLLAFTSVGRIESLLIAAIIGFLVMLVEGSAWGGLDNLLIPIFGFLLLRGLLPAGIGTLWGQLGLAFALALFVLTAGRFTTLRGGALFGAVLVGYLCWVLGGLTWVWVPLLVFAAYTFLPPKSDLDRSRTHNAQVLYTVCSAGLAWLVAARLMERPDFRFPFTVAFTAHLGIICAVRWRWARPSMPDFGVVAASTLMAAATVLLPYAAIGGATKSMMLHLTLGLAATAVAVAGFHLARRSIADPLPPGYRWGREALWAGIASLLAIVPILAREASLA